MSNLKQILAARRRGRLAATVALIAAVVVVSAVVRRTGSTPRSTASSATSVSGSIAVLRRDLVETDTESGTLEYASPRTVYNRLSGTITWLPSVGRLIKPGQALYKVNGQPVILLDGTTPVYRDLNPSDAAGQDILQLNRNLVALGFNPNGIVVDDTWQAATTAGLDLLQASVAEPETGSLSLGQVVFLPGNQLIAAVQATLGDGGSAATSTSARPPAATAQLVSLTTTAANSPETDTAKTTTSAATTPTATTPERTSPKTIKRGTGAGSTGSTTSRTLIRLTALLRAEAAQLKAAAAALKAANAASANHSASPTPASANASSRPGSSSGLQSNGGGGSAVLQTASTQLIATVGLDASKQSEAKVGEEVTVELPAGNTVDGVVTAVSSIAQSASNSSNGNSQPGNNGSSGGSGNASGSSAATIPVTIKLRGHVDGAGLDQAAVSVNFIRAVANNVLSVPVTALLAVPGGGYAVQAATAPRKLIPVTTGLFAAGYVEISGQGIHSGLQVTNSQG